MVMGVDPVPLAGSAMCIHHPRPYVEGEASARMVDPKKGTVRVGIGPVYDSLGGEVILGFN